MEQNEKLSDAEVLEILADAQESYEKYLEAPQAENPSEFLPTYSSSNPVGLVVDAILD
jgi:hypothetical protein